MDGLAWRFPLANHGEIKGINDAGVNTFSSNSLRSLVRESIQNSLDQASGDTVRVEFESFTIDAREFPDIVHFRRVIEACQKESGNSKDAERFFKNARSVVDNDVLRFMRVSDFGTSGLTGADSCKTGSNWSRLVKESGSSNKGAKSGGSFGIGKYSTFACSDIRTVFYSSMDASGMESHIGVSRLISFIDAESGEYTSGIGYFAQDEKNVAIQRQLELPGFIPREKNNPGTDILIAGIKEIEGLADKLIKYALVDFLVSFWKGRLVVTVDGRTVDARNLGKYVGELNIDDDDPLVLETIEHFDMLTSTDPSVLRIPFDAASCTGARKYGWQDGDCTLIIKEGDESLNREVMITRAAGMRLFGQNHISGHLCFTGILMIEGEVMNENFKEMEAPSHDEWSAERAPDPKRAENQIKAIKQWVREKVKKSFEKPVEDEIDAFGASKFLPMRNQIEENRGRERNGEVLEHAIREIRVKSTTPKRATGRASTPSGISANAEGTASRIGRNPGKGGRKNGGDAQGEEEGYVYAPIRQRLMCFEADKGSYRLRFTVPHDSPRAYLRFWIQGEQGTEDAHLSWLSGVRGISGEGRIDGSKIALSDVKAGERAEIDFGMAFGRYCMMEVGYFEAK